VEHGINAVRHAAPAEEWGCSSKDFWCYLEPPGHAPRFQGWKLHVSATPRNAEEVLTKTIGVLVELRCAFKFARGLTQLRELMSIRCERSQGGKFITVYPDDDDHFRQLAEALHNVTDGLEGPSILSDRPYRPGSLVHYRYGGFANDVKVLAFDGAYAPMLLSPDGNWERDERRAWFSPPAWARSPFPDTPQRKPDDQLGKPVLLDDRFVVREAIRQSNRGGVYRAIDQRTGEKVIIKQARPHVGSDLHEGDARDWLRHEAAMLDLLRPTGIAPRQVSLFVYEGHTFLAEESLDGTSLREWVDKEVKAAPDGRLTTGVVLDLAVQTVQIMRSVHELGLVFRDFNPGNLMVDHDRRIRLIDTEFLAAPGDLVVNAMTMGYASPEQAGAKFYGPAPDQSADLYGLGGSLMYLLSAVHPGLPPDEPVARPVGARVRMLASFLAESNPLAQRLLPLLHGLLADDPAERWDLDRVDKFLSGVDAEETTLPSPATGRPAVQPYRLLLDDGVRALARKAEPQKEHLYPPVRWEGATGDPCSVQAGAAGPVEVLRRAVENSPDDELSEAFKNVAQWLDRTLPREPRVLPGLFFGRSGSVWALHEAALALGDEEMAQRAVTYAKRIPIRWENPDLTHGLAGAGMGQLHMWRRTSDPIFRERTLLSADRLVKSCVRREQGIAWPIPDNFRSELAGLVHYGFAHGVAGVATFLLSAARELDRPDLLELAVAGGEALVAVGEEHGDGTLWPTGDNREERLGGLTWWCSGSAGVGAFLVRLWRATGDDRFLESANRAGAAVWQDRWLQPTVHCHGLAGSGELLLDLAAATGDQKHVDRALDIADCLYSRHVVRDGLTLVVGEDPRSVAYSYNLGLAGTTAFLQRLQHGGERMWMVDDFALPAEEHR
jgi:serine/threonine protein kinase